MVTNHVHADFFSNSDEAGHSSQMQLASRVLCIQTTYV